MQKNFLTTFLNISALKIVVPRNIDDKNGSFKKHIYNFLVVYGEGTRTTYRIFDLVTFYLFPNSPMTSLCVCIVFQTIGDDAFHGYRLLDNVAQTR